MGLTLLLAGLFLCGFGLWLLLSPTQYRATARIELKPDTPNANGQVSYDPYFIQTELEIIKSPSVLSNVVTDLKLDEIWGEKHKFIEGVSYSWDGKLETPKIIKLLQRRMTVDFVKNTYFIKISFTSEDPDEAAKIANAIAYAYQNYRWARLGQIQSLGVSVLEMKYQKEEQDIIDRQNKLEQLQKQLNVPKPEPADELLKKNYPPYFRAKQELQGMIDLHRQFTIEIAAEKLNPPKISMVQITNTAEPPKFPNDPNRLLGAVLLVVGLFPMVGGFLLLKPSRR